MTVTLRPAVQADAGFAALCVAAAYAPWIAVIGRKPWPMTQDYHEVIASDRVLIAEHDGQPVGLLVTRETADGFLVDNLAVLPECRARASADNCWSVPSATQRASATARCTSTPMSG